MSWNEILCSKFSNLKSSLTESTKYKIKVSEASNQGSNVIASLYGSKTTNNVTQTHQKLLLDVTDFVTGNLGTDVSLQCNAEIWSPNGSTSTLSMDAVMESTMEKSCLEEVNNAMMYQVVMIVFVIVALLAMAVSVFIVWKTKKEMYELQEHVYSVNNQIIQAYNDLEAITRQLNAVMMAKTDEDMRATEKVQESQRDCKTTFNV